MNLLNNFKHKTAKTVILLMLLWLLGHISYSTIDGLGDTGKSADIAVILGNKVNNDGSLSERLEKRLECGLGLYRQGRVKRLLVSGGLGKEGFYEGDKMHDYLVKNGVPDSVIIIDNLGVNTGATVENTRKLKDSLGFNSIIVVSQYYHLTRTKMLFRKAGMKNISSCAPRYFEIRDFYSSLREFVAFYSEL